MWPLRKHLNLAHSTLNQFGPVAFCDCQMGNNHEARRVISRVCVFLATLMNPEALPELEGAPLSDCNRAGYLGRKICLDKMVKVNWQ